MLELPIKVYQKKQTQMTFSTLFSTFLPQLFKEWNIINLLDNIIQIQVLKKTNNTSVTHSFILKIITIDAYRIYNLGQVQEKIVIQNSLFHVANMACIQKKHKPDI